MYQKSELYFFDQGSIDGKSKVKVERRPSYKIIRQNVIGGSDFQWFLHHNYLVSLKAKFVATG